MILCKSALLLVVLAAPVEVGAEAGRLAGFVQSRHWDEQTLEFTCSSGVRVHINAPAAAKLDPGKPTALVFYALPNGNTIEWTIGRAKAEGLDWHYFIQHIGAQTRRLREVVTDRNLIVAYLEAEGKSWPAWRKKRADSGKLILDLIQQVKERVNTLRGVNLILSGHSGGGSFIFGYLNAVERIPDEVERIQFLDSNYGFAAEDKHGDKLLEWLKRSPRHYLTVLAYDDREITLDGKKVFGPTGGTYRATQRMLEWFGSKIRFSESSLGDCTRSQALNRQIDIIVHRNPQNRILHTVLVGEMNGFIHAMTHGTAHEDKAAVFGGPVGYEKWIQAD